MLAEAGRFAESVLDPLYRTGDRDGAHWTPQGVVTPPGFKEAYAQFVEGGWPRSARTANSAARACRRCWRSAVEEIWASANLRVQALPDADARRRRSAGAVRHRRRSSRRYLPKMVSGEWTGTMISPSRRPARISAQMRTRAVPEGDHYRLFGQKIFIT